MNEPLVRGRLRGSGKRLAEGDQIIQDTRRLLMSVTSAAGTGAIRERGPLSMRFGTTVAYAQVQDRHRPFLFFTTGDRDVLERMIFDGMMGGTGGTR